MWKPLHGLRQYAHSGRIALGGPPGNEWQRASPSPSSSSSLAHMHSTPLCTMQVLHNLIPQTAHITRGATIIHASHLGVLLTLQVPTGGDLQVPTGTRSRAAVSALLTDSCNSTDVINTRRANARAMIKRRVTIMVSKLSTPSALNCTDVVLAASVQRKQVRRIPTTSLHQKLLHVAPPGRTSCSTAIASGETPSTHASLRFIP